MTPEDHQLEHVRLHKSLDELLACYLSQRGEPRTSIRDEIFALMKWSHAMTQNPEYPPAMREFLTAQNDDPELLEWLANADRDGGGFVKSAAHAALQSDHENYPLIRPVLLVMRKKYPAYEPSEAVKQEIRERATSTQASGPGPGSPSLEERNT